jgi:hypothetical protein
VAGRHRILERAAADGELVGPAHVGGSGAVEVHHEGDAFALGRWAAFAGGTRA